MLLNLKFCFLLVLTLTNFCSNSYGQSQNVEIKVFLEGPYNKVSHKMSTKLSDLGYLPGMQPKALLGKKTPLKDPYSPMAKSSIHRFNYNCKDAEGGVDLICVNILDDETGKVVVSRTELLTTYGHVSFSIENGTLASGKKYSIIIAHRNHLPVKSSSIGMDKGHLYFDFTAYHTDDQKAIDDIHVMIAGNLSGIDRDHLCMINQTDVDLWQKANGQFSSYFLEDVDLSGDVNVKDQQLILSNLAAQSSY